MWELDEGRLTPAFEVKRAKARLHHVHAAHAATRHAATSAGLLGCLGDDRLGGEDVLGDRRGVLERRANDHRRVGDPGLDEVLVLAGLDVEPVTLRRVPDLVDDNRAFEAALFASCRTGSSSERMTIVAPVRSSPS